MTSSVVFFSGTKDPHICDKGDPSVCAASRCAAEHGNTVSHIDAGKTADVQCVSADGALFFFY